MQRLLAALTITLATSLAFTGGVRAQNGTSLVTRTCHSVRDSTNGGTTTVYLSNGCYNWNGSTVSWSSGPSCSGSDSNALQINVLSWGYHQIDSGHAYFHCDVQFIYDPFGGGPTYHEYMDVFYNGTYTHHLE